MTLKYIDTYDNVQTLVAGQNTLLNGIANGTGINERNGRQVQVVAIEMRFQIAPISLSALGSVVRIIVSVDRQANGSTFALSDMLVQQPFTLSPYRQDSLERFTALYDETFVTSGYTTHEGNIVVARRFIEPKIVVQYKSSGNTAAAIQTNAINITYVSTDTTFHATILCYVRVYYTDY